MMFYLLSHPLFLFLLDMLIAAAVYSVLTRSSPIRMPNWTWRRPRRSFWTSLKRLLLSVRSKVGILVSLLVNVMKTARGIFIVMHMLR